MQSGGQVVSCRPTRTTQEEACCPVTHSSSSFSSSSSLAVKLSFHTSEFHPAIYRPIQLNSENSANPARRPSGGEEDKLPVILKICFVIIFAVFEASPGEEF